MDKILERLGWNQEMHEKAVEALSLKLEAIASAMLVPVSRDGNYEKAIGAAIIPGAYQLLGGDNVKFDALVEELFHKYKMSAKFSKNFIKEYLNTILKQLIKEQSTASIHDQFVRFVEEFESYSRQWFIVFPVLGIDLQISELQLGRVTFRPYRGEVFNSFAERIRSVSMNHETRTEEQKKKVAEGFYDAYVSKLKDFTCSEFTYMGEEGRCHEIALEETRKAVSLIRYAALFMSPIGDSNREFPHVIGVMGDVKSEGKRSVSIPVDDRALRFSSSIAAYPFPITEPAVAYMREVGVFKLSEFITKPNPSEFEQIILRAVRWLSSAQAQAEMENAFLNLFTSLETIFSVQPGEPITNSISEGIALIIRGDFRGRKFIKGKISAFYKQRSRLTHEGHVSISYEDYAELTSIIRDFMKVLIDFSSSFSTHDQFISWLEEQKLSGTMSFPPS